MIVGQATFECYDVGVPLVVFLDLASHCPYINMTNYIEMSVEYQCEGVHLKLVEDMVVARLV